MYGWFKRWMDKKKNKVGLVLQIIAVGGVGESLSVQLLVLCLDMTGDRPEKKREVFTILTQLLSPSVLPYHADLSGKSKG